MKLLFFILVGLSSCRTATSDSELNCTGVCLSDSENVFIAKSYEWNSDHGTVFLNPSGLEKKAVFLKRTVATKAYWGVGGLAYVRSSPGKTWTSKYASLTFSQAGMLFPMTGMNEKGLVVESLVLRSGTYPEHGTPNVNEMQWVTYQLDNFEKVQDVIDHIKDVSIEKDAALLHYLVCDATSDCVVIEFDADGKQVFQHLKDPKAKVITNHLALESIQHWYKEKDQALPDLSDASTTSGAASSLDRYRIARDAAEKLSGADVLTVEEIIKQVLQPVWIEGFTRWNMVHEPRKLKTTFRTATYRDVLLSIDVTKLKNFFRCKKSGVRSVDMQEAAIRLTDKSDTFKSLDITDRFKPHNATLEAQLVKNGLAINVTPGLYKYYKEKKGTSPNSDAALKLLEDTFAASAFGANAPKCKL